MSALVVTILTAVVVVAVSLVAEYVVRRESHRAGVEVARDVDDIWGRFAMQLYDEQARDSSEERARRLDHSRTPASENSERSKESLRPVARELALMSKYHTQGLTQSRVSFIFSIGFAAVGFILIAVALLTTDPDKAITDQSIPIAGVTSSIVIEAVASLFFVQSNRARQIMVEFFDRLRADRRLEEALQLADEMPDPTLRARMMLVLGLSLAERQVTDELLSVLIGVSKTDSMADRRGVVPPPRSEPISD